MRTTMGTWTDSSRAAVTTPVASVSQRRMPPNTLIKIALTERSDRRMRKALRICSTLAPPPTSRKLAGLPPANFLDAGGGANVEQIRNAFRILLSDKSVKAVLINVFCGILRGDIVAQGVVEAASAMTQPIPIVVRMEGTNAEQGRKILNESGLKVIVADGMRDAAEKVVTAAAAQREAK